jgi:predicted DNA-binding protein
MGNLVKITLRLPPELHARLHKKASISHRSLNSIIIEALQENLEQIKSEPESEYDQAIRVLRKHGLIEDPSPGWQKYIREAPDISHAELRDMLKGAPPLSEVIIEQRGPRE